MWVASSQWAGVPDYMRRSKKASTNIHLSLLPQCATVASQPWDTDPQTVGPNNPSLLTRPLSKSFSQWTEDVIYPQSPTEASYLEQQNRAHIPVTEPTQGTWWGWCLWSLPCSPSLPSHMCHASFWLFLFPPVLSLTSLTHLLVP